MVVEFSDYLNYLLELLYNEEVPLQVNVDDFLVSFSTWVHRQLVYSLDSQHNCI
jgi:hypothetical protein